MTHVELSAKDIVGDKVEALVVLAAKTDAGARLADPYGLSADVTKAINAGLTTLGAQGKRDEVTVLPGLDAFHCPIHVVGLGVKLEDALEDASLMRDVSAVAARSLRDVTTAHFAFPTTSVTVLESMVEGALLGSYSYREYKTKPSSAVETIVLHSGSAREGKTILKEGSIIADAQNWARDLVNMPPVDLYPAAFADIVKTRLAPLKVKVSVMDKKALAKASCGGHIGVGRGSARGPRLVTLSYQPAGATRHIAVVGKGITFDSGGLCIKPAAGMATMKCDMAGAAAVAAFIEAAAKLELGVAITGYLCLAENMTGEDAQRPGDVIRMPDGTTVEIDNTDAEGRLVMADGLCLANEVHPDLIIDIATLTGAAVLALGNRTAAVVGNNDAVRDDLIAASNRVGEHMWPMPMLDHLRPSIESDVADLKHTGERMGGLVTAAMFLHEFVGEKDGEKTDWIHLDIAAPAYNESGPYGSTPKGGTGFGVRTLLEVARAAA